MKSIDQTYFLGINIIANINDVISIEDGIPITWKNIHLHPILKVFDVDYSSEDLSVLCLKPARCESTYGTYYIDIDSCGNTTISIDSLINLRETMNIMFVNQISYLQRFSPKKNVKFELMVHSYITEENE